VPLGGIGFNAGASNKDKSSARKVALSAWLPRLGQQDVVAGRQRVPQQAKAFLDLPADAITPDR
jgi:hypothetical protein